MATQSTTNVKGEYQLGYVTSGSEQMYDGRNGVEINLGLANSPIGPAPELRDPLQARNPLEVLSAYPEDPFHLKTRKLIIQGIGLTGVDPLSIVFDGNGSYGGGDEVTRFLTLKGYNRILVPNYSFPNVAQWATRHAIPYIPISSPSLDPRDSIKQILLAGKDNSQNAIVYFDFPNNPYGLADISLIQSAVRHVIDNGGMPIVDLAFGEVLGDEFRQVIQDTHDQGGISLASISKTQGLPGSRSGYMILPPQFIKDGYSGAQRLVFGLSSEAELIYSELFKPQPQGKCLAQQHAERVRDFNIMTNNDLYQALRELGLVIGPTDPRTQIQVVIGSQPDLYQKLREQGLLTESLNEYAGTLNEYEQHAFGHSAVRMLTPGPGQLEEVIRRIARAVE